MHDFFKRFAFETVIDDICRLDWSDLTEEDLVCVAWVYYYFSMQFRECLETARELYPEDFGCCNSIAANAIPITFHHGPAWLQRARE